MSQGFEMESGNAKNTSGNQRKRIEVPEIGAIQQSLVQHFGEMKDPRVERTKKHLLTDILAIAILAIIAGTLLWEDIDNYGISKKQWLEEFLALLIGGIGENNLI